MATSAQLVRLVAPFHHRRPCLVTRWRDADAGLLGSACDSAPAL